MVMRRISIIVVAILILPALAFSATYYMRADGSAANKAAATSCGAAATAMSMAKHNSESFAAGDTIYLCDDGGSYTSYLLPPTSGSTGLPITYAKAVGDTPIIDVRAEFDGWTTALNWTDESGNIWSISAAAWSPYKNPMRVWLDGTEYAEAASAVTVGSATRWYYASDVLYVYATSNPATFYSSMKGLQEHPFAYWGGSASYITLSGLTFYGGYYNSVSTQGANNVIVDSCIIKYGSGGIAITGDGVSTGSSYITISNNTVDSGYTIISPLVVDVGDGIYLQDGVTYSSVYGNTIKNWMHGGIQLNNASALYGDAGVSYNYVYSNDISAPDVDYGEGMNLTGIPNGSGSYTHHNYIYNNWWHDQPVRIQFGGQYNEFHNNIISAIRDRSTRAGKENSAQGFSFVNWAGQADVKYNHVYNNTLYDIDNEGILAYTSGIDISSNTIQNNIVVDAGKDAGSANELIQIDDDNVGTNTWRNNLAYKSGVASPIIYHGVAKTVAEFNALTGDDGNTISGNISSDPLFVSATDFHLQGASPAKAAGLNLGTGYTDFAGVSLPTPYGWPIGAYGYNSFGGGTGSFSGSIQ